MTRSEPPGEAREGDDRSLFDPLFTTSAVATATSDRAWVEAMLEVEAAFARAQAAVGVIPAEAADAITAAAAEVTVEPRTLGRDAVASGNPVVPLVRALSAACPDHARPFVHYGATSQDVLDTAVMLLARRALTAIGDDLAGVADACALLARVHRGTVLAGRTLMQQAVPTTFGLKAAGWLDSVDAARARLAEVTRTGLAVQFGGAAGTLSVLGDQGVRVMDALAAELGLAAPALPWHTARVRVAALGAALGVAAGTLGKVAGDVILLAQTEVAEVAEPAGGGRGGSSTMPHKRNPVGAVLAAGSARRAPGLVATLLAAMPQEHERAAGAWHAEWETLTDLLRVAGGAAAHLREVLEGLRVDAGRMRANLDATGGLLMAEPVTMRLAGPLGRVAAHDLVRRACARAVEVARPLREILLEEPRVTAHLSAEEIDAALDPAGYLGSADTFVDRALAAHETGTAADGIAAADHETGGTGD